MQGRTVYSNELKMMICDRICEQGESTSRVATKFAIPLKTVEKWVTAYHKDPKVFQIPDGYFAAQRKAYAHRYDEMSPSEMIQELKRKDNQISYLESVICAYQDRQASLDANRDYEITL